MRPSNSCARTVLVQSTRTRRSARWWLRSIRIGTAKSRFLSSRRCGARQAMSSRGKRPPKNHPVWQNFSPSSNDGAREPRLLAFSVYSVCLLWSCAAAAAQVSHKFSSVMSATHSKHQSIDDISHWLAIDKRLSHFENGL
eukprot:scaffold188688_cov31-Tisochrysis_lutea.AAC.3